MKDIDMKKIGILFTSRNNYNMLDNWLTEHDYENFDVLNIDEDSSSDEKSLGKNVCKKHNIKYMDREKRGFLNNLDTSYKYFINKDIHWVVWFQHDCFPLTNKFFSKLNSLVSTGALDEFGLVGFNTYHRGPNVLKYKNGSRELQNIARAILEPGDNWYRHKSEWPNTRVSLESGKFDKPFAVETPAAFGVAINLKLYNKTPLIN